MKRTRLRIGPSPTGYPTLGTIYQALFNYAFAKRLGGDFIVRIEDTDRTRFVEDAEKSLYDALDWFNLLEDESPRKPGKYGPYHQSQRLAIYKQHVDKLLEMGHAYYCFCSKDRLDNLRVQQMAKHEAPGYDRHCRQFTLTQAQGRIANGEKATVRMKIPDNIEIVVEDGIRGQIKFDSNTIDDQVILKSDGYPTYHLAVVVDDHLMEITHVVRGEEWLPSSPKHILLYEFFGWEKPKFFHTSALRNPDRSKLSKRHGHTSIQFYRDQGYLPEAILNFIALLGWTHPQEKEIFDLSEFIKVFDLKDLRAVGPAFDLQKLTWLNGVYLRQLKDEDLIKKLVDFYQDKYPHDLITQTLPLIRERIKTLAEYDVLCRFFIEQPCSFELDLSPFKEILNKLSERIKQLDVWNLENIAKSLEAVAFESGLKRSHFFMIIRVAITGKKISPPLNESMFILGQSKCVEYLLR